MKQHIIKAVLSAGFWMAANVQSAELTISCGYIGSFDQKTCEQNVNDWSKKTGHSVTFYDNPRDSSELLGILKQNFAEQSPDVDVYMIDTIWVGILKNDLLDLTQAASVVKGDYFAANINANMVNGRLMAMPWFTDAGLLYYRKDLLKKYNQEPPQTWEDMARSARLIQDGERKLGKSKMHGFVFQAKSSESLTCNALEWIATYNGGSIVDAQGNITINNPQAIQALEQAKSWIGTISPKSVLNFGEEDARSIFQQGNAVFMRNWPYAWTGAQATDSMIRNKVGMMPLPKGGVDGKSAATLGGWELAVSKYSAHPKEATDLVLYLTSNSVQKQRALTAHFNPTIVSLYTDPELMRKTPDIAALLPVFESGVARPSTVTAENYNLVSNEFGKATSQALSGKVSATKAITNLEKRLEEIRNTQW